MKASSIPVRRRARYKRSDIQRGIPAINAGKILAVDETFCYFGSVRLCAFRIDRKRSTQFGLKSRRPVFVTVRCFRGDVHPHGDDH